MPSHSEGPGIWLSVWRFLLTHCLYERAATVLARLRGCAGSPEPSLLAYAISTKFAWRGPINAHEQNQEIRVRHIHVMGYFLAFKGSPFHNLDKLMDHMPLGCKRRAAIFDCGTPWRSFHCFFEMDWQRNSHKIAIRKIPNGNSLWVLLKQTLIPY